MTLSPNDILDQEFPKKFRGYDPEEVTSFLEKVADVLSETIKEKNTLKDKLAACKARVEEFEKREEDIRRALTTANKLCDEMKSQASREAELIVEQAKVDAERIVSDAHQEAVQLEARIRGLRRLQREALFKIRSNIEGYLRILDDEALPTGEFDQLLEETASEMRAIQSDAPVSISEVNDPETEEGTSSAEAGGEPDEGNISAEIKPEMP